MARPVARRGEGRARVVDAALELFAEHGVSGTSLQMIADDLGVTKAAVYFQFRAKEDIVLAVMEPAFAEMGTFVRAAEAATSSDEATEIVLKGLVDLVIRNRQAMAALVRDPEVHRILRSQEQGAALIGRVRELLQGERPTTRRRVAAAMVGPGLAEAGIDPDLADLDDAVLRAELLGVARTLLGAPQPARGRGLPRPRRR